MTSAQSMLLARVPGARLALGVLLALPLVLGACAPKGSGLVPPDVLVAPYDTAEGDVLWAVAPLRNESGTSLARTIEVSDALVASAQGVAGVSVLPLNRTLEAMRALGIDEVLSPDEASRLAEALGADAIIIGSVTAYDPYDPPTLGLSLALYARPGAMHHARSPIDTRRLRMQPTDQNDLPASRFRGAPVTVASEHLDARDHRVLLRLRRYANGRSDPTTALNWRIYTASMDLYTQFATHHAVRRLIDAEWLRLARIAGADTEGR